MAVDRYTYLDTRLNFPEMEHQLRQEDGKWSVFDPLRKKFLVLTPEEWVRQHMILFLTQFKGYPRSLFALEKGLQYNKLQKRFDILILNRDGNPFLLIECKAPEVPLSQKTLEQVCMYNKSINAEFIGISNGLKHVFFKLDRISARYEQLHDLPKFT
ncbi:hypothetical protein B879_02201 [Cecembia lonarensis LW9]|uniref:Type I restriction enzyme R protein N-terminal domain-containing protein n=2 Tax=Cecembia TaxID=1187078 RepID=K1KYI2_CECL9|nr:hypothetical protein B879_02201 [Cecembia lonarensis LW9]